LGFDLLIDHTETSLHAASARADLRIGDRNALDEFIRAETARERARVQEIVGTVENVEVHEVTDPQSFTTNVGGHAWLVTVPLDSWEAVIEILHNVSAEEREALSANVMVLAVERGIALPAAVRLSHVGDRSYLPMTPDMIQPFADQLELLIPGQRPVELVREVCDALVEHSRLLALRRTRDPSWPSVPEQELPGLTELRELVARELGALLEPEASALADALNVLIDQVQSEADSSATACLAGEMVDGQGFGPPENSALPRVWEALTVAAISASLLSPPN